MMVPGAGFEPAKHYAEDLESTPFDRSGTPARIPLDGLLLDYSSWSASSKPDGRGGGRSSSSYSS